MYVWIRDRGVCSIPQLVSACKKLVQPYGDEPPYSSNPIFWLVFPLLRLGILEYGIKEAGVVVFASNQMRFILPDNRIIQCNNEVNQARFLDVTNEKDADKEVFEFHPLHFLQSFPTIYSMVESYTEYSTNVGVFGFYRNLNTLKTEPSTNSNEQKVGLYKINNYPYIPFCLVLSNNKKKRIPLMGESLDALNYASCYVLMESGKPIFRYYKNEEKLCVLHPALLPVLISRALIQFDPKQLLDLNFHKNSVNEYAKIPLPAIHELQRIFSNTSVEGVND